MHWIYITDSEEMIYFTFLLNNDLLSTCHGT